MILQSKGVFNIGLLERGDKLTDYNNRLEQIIQKYELTSQQQVINDLIRNYITQNVSSESKVAIWGAGVHTEKLLKIIEVEKINLECFIDIDCKQWGNDFFGKQICSPKSITTRNIELVIVSSFEHEKEIISQLQAINPNCRYITIYEKYQFLRPFYLMADCEIHTLYKLYKNERKSEHLIRLISSYLEIRDFVNAKRFIREYVKNRFSNYQLFIDLEKELEELLLEIKTKLEYKTKDDILMILLDAVRYRDIFNHKEKNTKYLMEFSNRCNTFNNAFSTSIYTRRSIGAMFTGKLPLDDEIYENKSLNVDDSVFLSYLDNKGYKIYSNDHHKIFNNDGKINLVNTEMRSISLSLWEYICVLLQKKEQPLFYFIQAMELHRPHLCAYHEMEVNPNCPMEIYTQQSFPQEDEIQYKECLSYVDRQLEFYINLLSENNKLIVFGDHGHIVGKGVEKSDSIEKMAGCIDDYIHIPLMVYDKNYQPKEFNNLFSLKDFYIFMLKILNNEEINDEPCEYIQTQLDPIYNKKLKQCFINNGFEQRTHAFKLIRTNYDKYLLYDNGVEEYHLLENELVNLINKHPYKKRIEYIRNNMIKKEFPKFNKDKY